MSNAPLLASRQSSARSCGKFDFLAVVFVVLCGCANQSFQDSLSKTSDGAADSAKMRPKSQDASGASNADDDWNAWARPIRADRPVTQENDPLRDLFVSPRAQEIERSLGVGN